MNLSDILAPDLIKFGLFPRNQITFEGERFSYCDFDSGCECKICKRDSEPSNFRDWMYWVSNNHACVAATIYDDHIEMIDYGSNLIKRIKAVDVSILTKIESIVKASKIALKCI